jgi:serpin B
MVSLQASLWRKLHMPIKPSLALQSLLLAGCLLASSFGCGATHTTSNANSTAGEQSGAPDSGASGGAEVVAGETTAMEKRLALAYNEFGFKLVRRICEGDGAKNTFISPFSIAAALAMTYNGAAGETQQAMAGVLGVGQMTLDQLGEANLALRKGLEKPDPRVETSVANSLWSRKGVQFKSDFLDRNRRFYGAEIASLDFADPKSASIMNKWVETNTRGKIPQIVDQINADTVMILLNAIYFNGKWKKAFDKAATGEAAFNLAGGGQKKVQMMSQSGKYAYLKGDGFQAVSLPYGEGRLGLDVLLPDENTTLANLIKQLESKTWDDWIRKLKSTEGDVRIPRFKLEYERELTDPLKDLGMGVAFDASRANFEGMRQQRDVFIQRVKHKSAVEVNEEGTEAAASTSVEIGITSVASNRFFFNADRPFLIAIRDSRTGSVLFVGAIYEP